LKIVLGSVLATLRDARRDPANDPLRRTRTALHMDEDRLRELESQVEAEIDRTLESALEEAPA